MTAKKSSIASPKSWEVRSLAKRHISSTGTMRAHWKGTKYERRLAETTTLIAEMEHVKMRYSAQSSCWPAGGNTNSGSEAQAKPLNPAVTGPIIHCPTGVPRRRRFKYNDANHSETAAAAITVAAHSIILAIDTACPNAMTSNAAATGLAKPDRRVERLT